MHSIANVDVTIRIIFVHKFEIIVNLPWALPEEKVTLLTVPLKIDISKIKSVGTLLKRANQKIF